MKRVLVIEDDRSLARLAQINLEAAGYEVVLYHEGAGALAYLAEHQADLILLDLMVPTLSGWEVLDRLRQDRLLNTAPVMVVSALAQQDDQRRARAAGAAEYLVKPFSIRDLVARVDCLTGRADET